MLDIAELENRDIMTLSGGERQRVAIARALLRDDKIIFADEPSGNLNEYNTKILFEYIKILSKDRLFVIITHDSQIASEYGDRIIELKNGIIVEDNIVSNNNKKKIDIDVNMVHGNQSKSNDRWILFYSLNDFLKRKKKNIGILLITCIALICVMFILGFVSAINNMASSIDTSILENDKFMVQNLHTLTGSVLIDSDISDKLNNLELTKYAETYYSETVTIVSDNNNTNLMYGIVYNNDFYKARYIDIEGKLPNDTLEIMIDITLADMLFGSKDCIGKTVTIYSCTDPFAENGINLKISAVKNISQNEDGELYITKKLADKLYKVNRKKIIKIAPMKETDSTNLIYTNTDEYEYNNELLLGSKPQNANEIVISDDLVNGICNLLYTNDRFYSLNDIQTGIVNDALQKDIIEKDVELSIASNTSLGEYKIVVIWGIGLVALIFIFMSSVMIRFFMKITVMEREYEIGVLMALGSTKNKVVKILLAGQAILGLMICFLVAIITFLINCFGLTDLIVVDKVIMYNFEWWHLLVVSIISILLVVICSIPDSVRVSKKNIVKLLSDK